VKKTHFKPYLLAGLLSAAATQTFANGWTTGEAGYAPDYHRVAASAGATLDPDNDLLLQAEMGNGVGRNNSPAQETMATDYNLGLGYFPDAFWDVSLDGNLAYDSLRQRSSGGDLAMGLHQDMGWVKPSLTVDGGLNSYRLNAAGTEQDFTGVKDGLALGLGVNDYVSFNASGTFYQYDATPYNNINGTVTTLNPSDSGGFQPFLRPYYPAPGGSEVGQQGGSVRNPLLFGFPKRDWSTGMTVTLPMTGSTLTANYSQVEDYLSDAWVKSVGAAVRQELGADKSFAVKLGWCKAVESGSDQPFFSGGLTYYFRAVPKSATP
jgi:hypothetical protein